LVLWISVVDDSECVSDSLLYLTLPYREDVLPPSAEASNGPNVHPRINRKVTKSPSAVLTWVHTNTWNYPPPK